MLGIGRREFITLLGGAAVAWPLAARAQTGGRGRRIALLMPYAEADPEQQARNAGLRQGLHRLGWVEGRTVQIDTRFAPGGPDQVASLAKELTAMQPDVIVAVTTRVAAAFQRLRSGGINRVNTVRSGCRPANSVMTGSTRSNQGVGHGPSAEKSRCMSTQR